MKTIITSISILLMLSYNVTLAQDVNSFFNKANAFLSRHVSNGKVDYGKIHSDRSDLDELMKMAEGISVSPDNAKVYQAFWINSYNLATIKGLIDNYPTKSPLNHGGFFDKVKYSIGGKNITLNDIENKMLRAKFKDARFHFVLVCGAVGCPPLINKAYLPDTLDAQLDKQTRLAVNGSFVRVNAKKKRVQGSEILKWYKEDFIRNGSEIDFLNTYRTEKIPNDFKLSYFPYDWNINKQ